VADHARKIAAAEASLPDKFPGGVASLDPKVDAWIAAEAPKA
jgi:hypothetical protein